MATYSFSALGFDPAPGDPEAVESLARDCARAGRDLHDGAAQLATVGDGDIWEGEAADGFRNRTQQVRNDLGASGGACETAGSALLRFADALRHAQHQAHRAEDEAASAKARVEPVMGRQAGRVVTQYAGEVATSVKFTRATRPGTVAALRTRSTRPNIFNGPSRGPELNLHPRLQGALDRVPPAARSDFHGKCAEIRAIDKAFKRGSRLKDSVIQTRRVRKPGHPLHGQPHDPCPSCKHVLDQLKIQYMERSP